MKVDDFLFCFFYQKKILNSFPFFQWINFSRSLFICYHSFFFLSGYWISILFFLSLCLTIFVSVLFMSSNSRRVWRRSGQRSSLKRRLATPVTKRPVRATVLNGHCDVHVTGSTVERAMLPVNTEIFFFKYFSCKWKDKTFVFVVCSFVLAEIAKWSGGLWSSLLSYKLPK